MIRYALACDAGHHFESWFGDSDAFDSLAGRGLVACPDCGSTHVAKAIMAPAVSRSAARSIERPVRTPEPGTGGGWQAPGDEGVVPAPSPPSATEAGPFGETHRELRGLMRAMRSKVMARTQDVGDRFPEEARRMHDGDIPHRDIRGEATVAEARSLLEDGIMVLPVPPAPDELN